jgi:hypothetical protein
VGCPCRAYLGALNIRTNCLGLSTGARALFVSRCRSENSRWALANTLNLGTVQIDYPQYPFYSRHVRRGCCTRKRWLRRRKHHHTKRISQKPSHFVFVFVFFVDADECLCLFVPILRRAVAVLASIVMVVSRIFLQVNTCSLRRTEIGYGEPSPWQTLVCYSSR